MNGRLFTESMYCLATKRNHAARMMHAVVFALSVLVIWAAVTPVNNTVQHLVKIVPQREGRRVTMQSLTVNCSQSGKVVNVSVRENQAIRKGDIVLSLDSREYELQRDIELNREAGLKRELTARKEQFELRQAKSIAEENEIQMQLEAETELQEKLEQEREIRINSLSAERGRLKRELERLAKLRKRNAVSLSEVEIARGEHAKVTEELRMAELPIPASKVPELQAKLASSVAAKEESLHDIAMEISNLEDKLASVGHEVDLLTLKIQQSVVTALHDGLVTRCNVSDGDWVKPGPLEINIVPSGMMAEAFVPSRLISDVQVGNKASISVDGIDWMTNGFLSATVSEISPDLVQEEVVQGDGTSALVDGYRIWFELDPNEDFPKRNQIRLGMTGLVDIRTGKKRLALYLMETALGSQWLRSH